MPFFAGLDVVFGEDGLCRGSEVIVGGLATSLAGPVRGIVGHCWQTCLVPEKVPALIQPPDGYEDWLADLKVRIHAAQQRAALTVNTELLRLYWQIGRDILDRQAKLGWGGKIVERLAHDLRTVFPDLGGSRGRTSCTCAHSPRHGLRRKLSNSLLDKSRGGTTPCS